MIVIDLVLWRQGRPRLSTGRAAIAFCMWDDVVWHDNARSPGSGGASPYLRRGFADGLAFGVTPHRGNQREAGVLLRYGCFAHTLKNSQLICGDMIHYTSIIALSTPVSGLVQRGNSVITSAKEAR
jgi:hypothetical protein